MVTSICVKYFVKKTLSIYFSFNEDPPAYEDTESLSDYDINQEPIVEVKEENIDYSILENEDDFEDEQNNQENLNVTTESTTENITRKGPAVVYQLFEKRGIEAKCKLCSKVTFQ